MTPEDILQGLKDIHLPAEAGSAAAYPLPGAPLELAWWPFLVLAFIFGSLVWLAARRRNLWRRQGQTVLRQIDSIDDDHVAEAELIRLRERLRQVVGKLPPLPDAAFTASPAAERRAVLRAYMHARICR